MAREGDEGRARLLQPRNEEEGARRYHSVTCLFGSLADFRETAAKAAASQAAPPGPDGAPQSPAADEALKASRVLGQAPVFQPRVVTQEVRREPELAYDGFCLYVGLCVGRAVRSVPVTLRVLTGPNR